jgi:hypothetical protein
LRGIRLLERFGQRMLLVGIVSAGFLLKIICAPHRRMIRHAKDLLQQFQAVARCSRPPIVQNGHVPVLCNVKPIE